MAESDNPQPRFPFLTRALSDEDVAERLGQLLSDGAPVGESEDELIRRIQGELVARASDLLTRLFPRLEGHFEPYALVKDFSFGLMSTFRSQGMTMVTRAQFFAAAQVRMRGIILDRLRRNRLEQEHLRRRPPPIASPSAARAAIDYVNLEMALEAVDHLDPEMKQIFDMKLSGLTYREIEAQIGLAPATAQRRWENAQQIIKAEIGRLAGGDHGERRVIDRSYDDPGDDH